MDLKRKEMIMNRIFSSLLLLFIIRASVLGQEVEFRYSKADIDYNKYFSDSIYNQTRPNEEIYNLKPMLEVGVCVPNGGIYRLFNKFKWKEKSSKQLINIFLESPYTEKAPLIYNRYGWYSLESNKGDYKFDNIIEPFLIKAYNNNSRVILGIASMCGESSHMSHTYKGRYMAIPDYLYEELDQTQYPAYEDNTYGKGYTVNYDSPLLFKRYNKLLKSFSKWLDGNLKGTNIKRKDIIYAIEMRYMGYWGEGSVKSTYYPSTNLIDRYIDSYVKYFPDVLLIAGGQETLHLPTYENYIKNKDKAQYKVAMRHVYKLMTTKNKIGNIGMFIDSWHKYSNQYDLNSRRIIMNDNNEIISLANFLKEETWGNIYLTGEFGYLTTLSPKGDIPYSGIYQQFSTRHISGISIHNLTVSDSHKQLKISDEVYKNVKRCLSMMGYRLVFNSLSTHKHNDQLSISFCLKNIGVSKIFHDYYELHYIIKDNDDNIILDYSSDFDFRTIGSNKDEPLLYVKGGSIIQDFIPYKKGKLYLKIIDKKGIEHPMCLSNYGRIPDGSYYLTELK